MFELPELTRKEKNDVVYFTDDCLFSTTGVRIAFTSRAGGKSEGCYSSLNLGKHVNDSLCAVESNRKKVIELFTDDALGISVISPHQVHGSNLIEIKNASDLTSEVQADGVICSRENVAPLLCFADCCPVILVSQNGCFAVVHAGWRGVINRISEHAFRKMVEKFDCSSKDINAYVGPHLGQCCFEVSSDVAEKFKSEFTSEVLSYSGPKAHVSMSLALKEQLVSAGLLPNRFLDLGMCTKCKNDLFFSYRASEGRCGREGAMAVKGVSIC